MEQLGAVWQREQEVRRVGGALKHRGNGGAWLEHLPLKVGPHRCAALPKDGFGRRGGLLWHWAHLKLQVLRTHVSLPHNARHSTGLEERSQGSLVLVHLGTSIFIECERRWHMLDRENKHVVLCQPTLRKRDVDGLADCHNEVLLDISPPKAEPAWPRRLRSGSLPPFLPDNSAVLTPPLAGLPVGWRRAALRSKEERRLNWCGRCRRRWHPPKAGVRRWCQAVGLGNEGCWVHRRHWLHVERIHPSLL
mmetsp:Transcript_14149/g.36525  ORF Transcript_14149/g.36525 Transcript_14149/m.36525 type:complete len:249 (-) Transcript_14149:762-1508(-)